LSDELHWYSPTLYGGVPEGLVEVEAGAEIDVDDSDVLDVAFDVVKRLEGGAWRAEWAVPALVVTEDPAGVTSRADDERILDLVG
jgi:hypothetical protein